MLVQCCKICLCSVVRDASGMLRMGKRVSVGQVKPVSVKKR